MALTGTYTDPNDQAQVRVVHVSPDTPALNIIRASALQTPIAQNISFGDRSDYVSVANGDVDLIAQPADSCDGACSCSWRSSRPRLGLSYSAYAIGPLARGGCPAGSGRSAEGADAGEVPVPERRAESGTTRTGSIST